MTASIVRADALALPLGDATVDLVVTSPPYFALRSYQDGGEHYDGQIGSEGTPAAFLEALWAVMCECWRVLKPSGSVWVNLGDKYAGVQPNAMRQGGLKRERTIAYNDQITGSGVAFGVRSKSLMGLPWRFAIGCIDGQADPEGKGWILRAEVVWAKPNGLPESVTDRVRRSHEQWFHFTKEPRYFCDIDPIREAVAYPDDTRHLRGGRRSITPDGGPGGGNTSNANPLGKLPDSVWTIPTQPLVVPESLGVDHFAAFPTEWPRRIITAWSPSGICTACGEGRQSVSDKQVGAPPSIGNRDRLLSGGAPTGSNVTRTITGEACACPDTSAPTRQAVVLDPFGGTGTTAMVAKALGRYGVSVDLSADYLKLANWRINESDHVARVQAKQAGRTYKPAAPEMDGQASIFDLEAS